MPKPDAELQLDQFIDKFSKDMGKRIRDARAKMRASMPQALELVYDNYPL
jgi:vacuolar-type H+-ATPase subunit H